jgi:hypothetical protein
MHLAKEALPVKIDVPGATARQLTGFGDATPYGPLAGEFFSLGTGTDIAPLLQGLAGDACHAPHWGYLISGELLVSYTSGDREKCSGGDLFYWPPGHSVRVEQDAEVILFSPQAEHGEVLDHMIAKMSG